MIRTIRHVIRTIRGVNRIRIVLATDIVRTRERRVLNVVGGMRWVVVQVRRKMSICRVVTLIRVQRIPQVVVRNLID